MNKIATIEAASYLPTLIDRAAKALASARSAAEVLEARDMASVAYDAAKKAARLAKAKGAHDELIAAAHRAQADALEIEAQAKRRLADEYDAAQARGEVRADRQRTASAVEAVGVTDIGLTHKDIHEARAAIRFLRRRAVMTRPAPPPPPWDPPIDFGLGNYSGVGIYRIRCGWFGRAIIEEQMLHRDGSRWWKRVPAGTVLSLPRNTQ